MQDDVSIGGMNKQHISERATKKKKKKERERERERERKQTNKE